MRWLSFLVAASVFLWVFCPPKAVIGSGQPVVITSISHNKKSETHETITIQLAAPVVPKIFVIRGDRPRLVMDFPQAIYLGKNLIALPQGGMASAIRIGLHRTPVNKTRVVADLSRQTPVHYTSEYLEQEKTLIVTLGPGTAEPRIPPVPALQPRDRDPLPGRKDLSGKPLEKETSPPVVPGKEMVTQPVADSAGPGVPTILEISFDASASRGEMVLIRLNVFKPPTVSAIEKERPRVVCDFPAMHLGAKVQEVISAKGKYIERIDIARNQDTGTVRVILELSPDRDYDLRQVFFKNDNLFVLIVNDLAPARDDS
jgi:hypothetical protein